jgi:hypothetical protein
MRDWAPLQVPVLGPNQLVSLRTGQVWDCEEWAHRRSAQSQRLTRNFRAAINAYTARVVERRALAIVYRVFWPTRTDGTSARGPSPSVGRFSAMPGSSSDRPLSEKRRAYGQDVLSWSQEVRP